MKLLVPSRKGAACFVGIVLPLVLGPAAAAAQEKFISHPPMRPLPAPSKSPLVKGTRYFVDAAKGDDRNDGSEARPWKTVQHGARRLTPGETLYLRGGVYYEKVRLTRPGTAAILAVALLFLVLPFAVRLYGRARGRTDLATLTEASEG